MERIDKFEKKKESVSQLARKKIELQRQVSIIENILRNTEKMLKQKREELWQNSYYVVRRRGNKKAR